MAHGHSRMPSPWATYEAEARNRPKIRDLFRKIVRSDVNIDQISAPINPGYRAVLVLYIRSSFP